jgi:tetratricopeptide (TPR) repeat protein
MSGEREQSFAYLHQAMPMAQALDDKLRQANILRKLGVEEAESEHFTAAIEHWGQALHLYWRLNLAGEAALVCSNLGRLYAVMGNEKEATHHLTAAIELATAYNLPELEAFAKTNMAKLRIQQRKLEEASVLLESAHRRCIELKLPELTEVLSLQKDVALLLKSNIEFESGKNE